LAGLAASEKQQLADELADLQRERSHLESYLALLRSFADRLERNWHRQEELVARGFSTLSQAEARQQAHMSYRLQVELAEREWIQLGNRIARMEHEMQMHDEKTQIRLGEL